MKKIVSILLYATALIMVWGCSSSDDDDNGYGNIGEVVVTSAATAPDWAVTLQMPPGDVKGKPNWDWDEGIDPEFRQYENNMTAILYISNEMLPFTSDDDRMAALIDGDVREVAPRVLYDQEEGIYTFMLFIPYDADEDMVEVQYYNAQTNMTYFFGECFSVQSDAIGNDEEYWFTLFDYSVVTFNLKDLPFNCKKGDKLALFVGDVCCGMMENEGGNVPWTMKVFRPNEDGDFSKATIRYYSTEKKAIYSINKPLNIRISREENLVFEETLSFKE